MEIRLINFIYAPWRQYLDSFLTQAQGQKLGKPSLRKTHSKWSLIGRDPDPETARNTQKIFDMSTVAETTLKHLGIVSVLNFSFISHEGAIKVKFVKDPTAKTSI